MTISKKELSDKEMEESAKKTLNYNDRLDGYGFGESDAEAEHDEEEKGSDPDEAERYGEVDQYTFRQSPLGGSHKPNEKIKKDIDSTP